MIWSCWERGDGEELRILVILSLLEVYLCFSTPISAQQRDKDSNAGRNLSACIAGLSSCNLAVLTPTQISEVAAASKQRNLASCLSGFPNCDPARLTQKEAAEVATAFQRRNLENCLNNLSTCDPVRLNDK